MLFRVLGRTWRISTRNAPRIAATQLVVLVVFAAVAAGCAWLADALLGGALEAVRGGSATGADTARLLSIGLPLALVAAYAWSWAQLAPLRAAAGSRLAASLSGATTGAPRLLVLVAGWLVIVGALVAAAPVVAVAAVLVLVVPSMIAIAQVAIEPRSFGLVAAWRLGVRRPLPTLGATFGVLFALALLALLVAALALGPAYGVVGVPASDADLTDVAGDALLALIVGGALALVPLLVVPVALVAAVHAAATGSYHDDWDDEFVDPEPGFDELSPAARALLAAAPSGEARRLRIPPRSTIAARVPGPGVMAVAGVELPVGRATRQVDDATLELSIGDGEPGEAPNTERLWVSRDPITSLATTWKRLAAGFEASGLWPLAVPVTDRDGRTVDWFEHATRRDAAALGADPDVARIVRARLLESLGGGSPLGSTELLAASATAAGTLRSGTGRRPDAIDAALVQVGAARLALVPARRPADAIHVLAWPGASAAGVATDELAELFASWEERWGAILVGLGEDHVVLAVLRPPSTLEEATELVAEQHALCPDEAAGWGDAHAAARRLVDAPTWRLSWH